MDTTKTEAQKTEEYRDFFRQFAADCGLTVGQLAEKCRAKYRPATPYMWARAGFLISNEITRGYDRYPMRY